MPRTDFYAQIGKNKRDSAVLAVLVAIVLMGLFYLMGLLYDPSIVWIFLLVGVFVVAIDVYGSYNYGDRVVLASVNAKPADEVKHRYVIDSAEGLSIAAGIPAPKVYVVENDEINAFAVGKDPKHASIAVTTGAIKNLKRDELEGVIGHEISHIANYDIMFATLVAVLVGLIGIVSYMLIRSWRFGGRSRERGQVGVIILVGFLLAILAPIVSRFVQAAVSRRRELLADANSAKLTRYPEGLASALDKIRKANEGKMAVSESVSHLFFVDPTRSPLDELYATHPKIEDRIRILREM